MAPDWQPEFVSEIFNLQGAVEKTTNFTKDDYEKVVKAVIDEFERTEDIVGDNVNTRGAFVGCVLRTAGHDMMDFRKNEIGEL